MHSALDDLDDRTVIRALLEFSEDFVQATGKSMVEDHDTAVEIVDSMLSREGFNSVSSVLASEPDAIAAGRRLLERLAKDPATAATVATVLDEPPGDTRLTVESLVASGAVLGAVLTWLQTKVDITVHRKDGKTEVQFEVQKQQASDTLLKALADMVWSTLRGHGGQGQS